MQQVANRPSSALRCPASRRASVRVRAAQVQTAPAKVTVAAVGAFTVQGTVRKVNEDRFAVESNDNTSQGEPFAFAGVYDGHGGSAVAEWLEKKLSAELKQYWKPSSPEAAFATTYLQADKQLLTASNGFLGLGERGVGGSKCGATAVNAVLVDGPDGTNLVTANVGDARILLIRNGQPVVLTEEHVPDTESERQRIERQNPNPKQPMVRYVGGTWRVGGLLALSRAFGDAYLKGSMQFEGISYSGNDYSSGFGVVADPYTTLTPLGPGDSYVVLASDGLFAEEVRGGGGGLDNETVAELCTAGAGASCDELAKTLALTAQQVGSTDDVTVVVMKLSTAK